ncbi:MAG: hypothetical protein Sapg2KO_05550 [Saprospiraceae bacterium]
MLKFFRKIRQRLLNQGKLRRYFVYAIGEIFLVVIGILIALQVNNWNELRKGERIKQKYIQALQDDLEGNVVEIDHQRLLNALSFAHFNIDFSYVKSTYNDLVASGKITLYDDMEFKRKLDNYYLHEDWTKTTADVRSRILLEDYWDVHLKYVDPNLKRKAIKVFNSQESWEQSDFEKYAIDFVGMNKDRAFTAQLKTVIYIREVAGNTLNYRIKKAEDLLSQLQAMER